MAEYIKSAGRSQRHDRPSDRQEVFDVVVAVVTDCDPSRRYLLRSFGQVAVMLGNGDGTFQARLDLKIILRTALLIIHDPRAY